MSSIDKIINEKFGIKIEEPVRSPISEISKLKLERTTIFENPYEFLEFDLGIERTDIELGISGSFLTIFYLDASIEIRINDIRSNRIPLSPINWPETINFKAKWFDEIYLTNAINEGKTLKIFVSNEINAFTSAGTPSTALSDALLAGTESYPGGLNDIYSKLEEIEIKTDRNRRLFEEITIKLTNLEEVKYDR